MTDHSDVLQDTMGKLNFNVPRLIDGSGELQVNHRP